MSFEVRLTPAAWADLERLYAHLLLGAQTLEDLEQAEQARSAVLDSLRQLARSPFLYRKASDSAFLRELVVPFGGSGYVLLYEIVDAAHVDVLAVRHQFEDDYH
ncbi:MAG: type II toxin-antitoxin system RelE/ParE family toxin [Comamonadaceae bacterium]|nr:type II toxin-antitoxin system RelE/ParE family toxin [Comamonadaceae bacterium]